MRGRVKLVSHDVDTAGITLHTLPRANTEAGEPASVSVPAGAVGVDVPRDKGVSVGWQELEAHAVMILMCCIVKSALC